MVVDRFREGDPIPVYRRLRDKGRALPEGLRYVASWVTPFVLKMFGVTASSPHWLLRKPS
jgi:hypothetical protein